MSIRYTTEVDGDTLLARAWGFDESLAEVQEYGGAVIEAAVRNGVRYVLCDELALEYRLGTLDTFAAAEFIATHAPRVLRVAIACDPKQLPDARFWEDVAVNRGVAVRVFDDLEKAKAWLGQQASEDQPEHHGERDP